MEVESLASMSSLSPGLDVTRSSTRFGINDLLWLIAFVAVFLQFAFQSVGFRHYLLPAAVLAAFVFAGMRMAPTSPKALILALGFSFLLLGLVPNWFSVAYAVLLCASSVIRCKANALYRLRWHTCLLGVALVAGNVLDWVNPPSRLVQLYEARQKFPLVDLRDRLAELRPAISTSMSVSQRQNLGSLSEAYDGKAYRLYHLEKIHSKTYEDFLKQQGFGAVRILPMSSRLVQLPELYDVPYRSVKPSRKDRDLDSEDSRNANLGLNAHQLFRFADDAPLDLQTYNQKSFANFVLPATLGFVSEPKHATGFEPHGFRFAMPKLSVDPKPNTDPLASNYMDMSLNRLELVSLLNFETPRVYVLDHLPRMDQLRGADFQTRELDSFEKSGLERLVAGENLVSERTGSSFRMLGAIPAIDQCLQCHDGQVGNLLGAFSYEFK